MNTEQVEERCELDTDWLWASNTAGIPWKWEYYLQAASRVQTFSISGPICTHIHWCVHMRTKHIAYTTKEGSISFLCFCEWHWQMQQKIQHRRFVDEENCDAVEQHVSMNLSQQHCQQLSNKCISGWNPNKWRLCTATGVYLSGKFITAQWSSGINFKGIQNEIYKQNTRKPRRK